ncbi:Ger(x)C family spore germination protein [Paenibacillus protaetiae]|uniref:Ger(X)C family spore germination protein n=1 Tax=Paenibacillus protaetiae TaxID=2509456 RepID=A0A4P6ESF2_9BACL|nr:Ger(x)C family spore germination protein [Paenibacillus protaetiae]QAY65862.1 Ger(x)C family spore germination protein [Paenibacillus protaetiae]
MKVKQWLCAGMIAAMVVLTAGCWDLIELNRSVLLTGVAFEPGTKKPMKVTYELINSAEGNGSNESKGQGTTVVFTSEGNTIEEATYRINEKSERILITSHIRVIIIDEKLARNGLDKFIDIIQRSRYVREDVIILIAKGVPAADLLKTLYPGEQYASSKIQSQVQNFYRVWGGIPESRLYQISRSTLTEGYALTLGAVTLTGDPKAGQTMDELKEINPHANVKILGAAVFKDQKLVGYLNIEQTRAINIIQNKLDSTSLTVPLDQPNTFVSLEVDHTHTKTHIRKKGERFEISLKVDVEGIVSSLDENIPLDKVKGFAELEERASQYLEKQLESAIRSVQKNEKADVFGFGQQYYRRHNKQFKKVKNWDQAFSQAKIHVDANFHITRSDLKVRRLNKEQAGS